MILFFPNPPGPQPGTLGQRFLGGQDPGHAGGCEPGLSKFSSLPRYHVFRLLELVATKTLLARPLFRTEVGDFCFVFLFFCLEVLTVIFLENFSEDFLPVILQSPPRGVLEPFGPKVENRVENELLGAPVSNKLRTEVKKSRENMNKSWKFRMRLFCLQLEASCLRWSFFTHN